MDISFKNVFVGSIKIINQELLRIVVALDEKDAKETIENYYDEPEILYLISFDSLKVMYEKAKNEKNYYLVIESKENEGKINYIIHEEILPTQEALIEKYSTIKTFILDSQSIISICSYAALELEKPKQQPLISEKIDL